MAKSSNRAVAKDRPQTDPAPPAKLVKSASKRSTPLPRRASSDWPADMSTEISWHDIATLAYQIYADGAPGGELDHWLAAENELKSRRVDG